MTWLGEEREARREFEQAGAGFQSDSQTEQRRRYEAYAWVAEQFERDRAAGRQPDADALVHRYPHLAEELRQLVETLRELHDLSGAAGPPTTVPRPAMPPHALGDFRIIREIGRGGMGIVYEAEQISLRRPVALKVLPFAGLFTPHRLQRFKNEAMAAASLHHPNIVPVFAVGSERGVHYYAMQLIDGRTLADELAALRANVNLTRRATRSDAVAAPQSSPPPYQSSKPPSQSSKPASQASGAENTRTGPGASAAGDGSWLDLSPTERAREPCHDSTASQSAAGTLPLVDGPQWSRDVAAVGIDVASALQYAHERGIVHRDIKPSNLLRDAEGKVWVTDFGLAQIEADAGLTLTGDLLGTPRYMSPEQAAGGPAMMDHRTDIYSLGVTLYELLTLRPAFPGSERGQLLRAVTSETVTPSAIRRLNPSVPTDLQTIINKAIAKDPRERYGSAEQLADDLQRFLDHKPIVARPATHSEQLAKWIWRHRSIAGLAFGALLFATLVLAATSLLVWREQSRTATALKRSEALARETDTLRRLAEEAAGRARVSAREERRQSEFARTLLYVSDLNRAHQALTEGDLPQLARLLDRHVPQAGRSDVRGVEWHWLRRQAERPRRSLAQLDVPIYHTCRSADGRWLAYAGADGFIYLVELPSWRLVRRIASGQREVNSVAFSPDGRTLASAGDDGTACLWDLADGERLRTIAVSSDLVFGVAFTPDGRTLLTCGQDPRIRLWDVMTGQLRGELGTAEDRHARTVEALAISPDGRHLASISADATLRLWDLETAECLRILRTGTGKGTCVAISPDGGWLATGNEDGTLLISNLVDGSTIYHARHPDGIHCLRFESGSETLVVGDSGGSLRRWTFVEPTRQSSSSGRIEWFSQRGRLVKRVHPVDLPAALELSRTSGDRPGNATAVRLLPAYSASLVDVWQAHRRRIFSLEGDPAGEWLVSAGEGGRLALWTRSEAASSGRFDFPAKVIEFGFLPTSDRLAIATGTELQVVSIASGQVLRSAPVAGDDSRPVRPISLAVSPDGASIAVGFADGWISILDSQTLVTAARWQVAAGAEIRGFSFSPDSTRLLATAWKKDSHNVSGSVGSWQFDVSSGRVLGQPLEPYSVCRYSTDGTLLAAKATSRLDLLAVETGRRQSTLGRFSVKSALAFSPDGRLLATATSDRTVLLWDIPSRKPLATLASEGDDVNVLAFSPDGRTLATGGDGADPAVRLWNVATGQMLFQLCRGAARIKKLQFTRDGRYLAIRQDNGSLQVFDMSPLPLPSEDTP